MNSRTRPQPVANAGLVPPGTDRGRGGYTMVELAIVIVLASLLTSLAVWKTGPALQHARIRQVAATVSADLQYAQMIAARQREPVVVIFNPSLKLILIRSRDGTTEFRRRFMGPGTEYGLTSMAVTPTTTVEVFPNGIATETITVTASAPGYTRRVRLTRAGQVRVLP
jgi:prepilin-type N-terminal cleavage/methylation domain-containing protein